MLLVFLFHYLFLLFFVMLEKHIIQVHVAIAKLNKKMA